MNRLNIYVQWDHGDKIGYYEQTRLYLSGIDEQLNVVYLLSLSEGELKPLLILTFHEYIRDDIVNRSCTHSRCRFFSIFIYVDKYYALLQHRIYRDTILHDLD